MSIVLPILSKPTFGEPCNGCGYCCQQEVCRVGLEAFGPNTQAPCPALVLRDGRTWCGVIEAADGMAGGAFGSHMRLVMGIGLGCDADDAVEPCPRCGMDDPRDVIDGRCAECRLHEDEATWTDDDEADGGSPWGR